MKLTRNTLLTTALLSLLTIGQVATAGQAPKEVKVFENIVQAQYQTNDSRVNYSISIDDLDSNTSDLFTDHER